MIYLLLQNPGHNRVYYNLSGKLALTELKIAIHKLSIPCKEIKELYIEGVKYLLIETEHELKEEDLNMLSRLSFIFAIFILEKIKDKNCLIPVKKIDYVYLDSKISSLLKYHGKTNELFTKMMVNVALLSSKFNYTNKIKLLDPVAGKGTTLFEGIIYGFDSYGIEYESKFVHESVLFFKKYLETERIKHNSIKRQIYGPNKRNAIDIHEFEFAKTKEEFASKESIKKVGFICGNSQDAHKYFKKELFHLIVGDLPYGIVHGNTSSAKNTSFTKNPSDLLSESISEWKKVLIKGGVAVMAWNSYLVSRIKLSDVFTNHGFEVLNQSPYDEFERMVDKSIKRDIIVAKKN